MKLDKKQKPLSLLGQIIEMKLSVIVILIAATIVDSFIFFTRSTNNVGANYHDHKFTLRSSTSVAVTADDVLSPTEINQVQSLVTARGNARWKGDYQLADDIRLQIRVWENNNLPKYLSLDIRDLPRNEGGGSNWSMIYNIADIETDCKQSNVLHLSRSAMGLAAAYSERGSQIPFSLLLELETKAKFQLNDWYQFEENMRHRRQSQFVDGAIKERSDTIKELQESAGKRWIAISSNLSGRKSADAALYFALAGSTDVRLFELLLLVSLKELRRFGKRSSCRSKDILNIIARLAAAGVRPHDNIELVDTARNALQNKSNNDRIDPNSLFYLHANHTALVIWKQSFLRRASAKSNIAIANADLDNRTQTATTPEMTDDWWQVYADPNNPLVVDLGCGMGISLLGLASGHQKIDHGDSSFGINYNYLGADLSSLTINYAKGIAQRWSLETRVAFVVEDAKTTISKLESYPGSIMWVFIQFPTPYLLNANPSVLNSAGNSRLPKSATDGFMVDLVLLQQISAILRESQGKLLLQSNCEDVAVWIRDLACDKAHFSFSNSSYVDLPYGITPNRSRTWYENGGKRAIGAGWSPFPILPPEGRSETEVACIMSRTPIHRCVLLVENRQ